MRVVPVTYRKIEEPLKSASLKSASPEDLTRAALTQNAQLQALAALVASLMARLEEVNRAGVKRSSRSEAS
jgi:hypothetical protein